MSGIIFDLDDTLVKTQLDFKSLKQDIGCPPSADILSFIDSLTCPIEQSKANETVLAHEIEDARSSFWIPGAEKFVQDAMALSLPLAIVTRNCREATMVKMEQNNIPISVALTREDAPPKPDPTALLHIADNWGITPPNIAYIGDYIYDIQAAHNANMQAWLFDANDESEQNRNKEGFLEIGEFSRKLRLIHPKSS